MFRLGRVIGQRHPGLRLIIPFVDVMHQVSMRVITMPIQSQGIITRDNVSVDVSAEAYFKVVDAAKAVVAIENVYARSTRSPRPRYVRSSVNAPWMKPYPRPTGSIRTFNYPSMKRAMARQAEAEREKRAKIIAKIINAERKSLAAAALGDASDTMMEHPLALQLRNLQSLVEVGADKNTTVVLPAPLMNTISELGAFLAREATSGTGPVPDDPAPKPPGGAPLPKPAVANLPEPVPNGAVSH